MSPLMAHGAATALNVACWVKTALDWAQRARGPKIKAPSAVP